MYLLKHYNVTELSVDELNTINGGEIFKKLGKWIGKKWKSFKCSCGKGEYYTPDYTQLLGYKL